MPLISDHEISTSGVIGSVVHLAEDDYGARIRAKFSGIAKAQTVRQLMLEKHLSGMSFTYEPVRFHRGTFRGEPARFLDEVRVFEASVVPLPMNVLAVASAKAGTGVADLADVDQQLRELEQWAAAATATSALRDMVEHPDSAMYALGVMQETRLQQDLARLEQWALSQPPSPPVDPTKRPDRTSRAELAHREALALAKYAPQTRCGVCVTCRYGGRCERYG